MPLSSVVGSSSIMQPGVCTSTNKPASPYDGQVIYMTDVDQTAVWDGTQWTVLAPITGNRNKIINGGMSVWQRGTSFADPANIGYTTDRWAAIWGTTGRTFSRQAGFANSQYCLRVQRNSGSTGTGNSGIATFFETVNSIPLQGKTVTLSFNARCGANYSATSNLLYASIHVGTGTDQSGATWYTPGWTGTAQVLSQTATLTTTSQRFSYTTTIPATTTQIAIYFLGIPTGTAGANDYWEITNVQLEEGAVATPFEFEDYGTTLDKCQRYYCAYPLVSADFSVSSGALMFATIYYPTTMRAAPTITQTGSIVFNANCASTFSTDPALFTSGATTVFVTSTATARCYLHRPVQLSAEL